MPSEVERDNSKFLLPIKPKKEVEIFSHLIYHFHSSATHAIRYFSRTDSNMKVDRIITAGSYKKLYEL